MTLRSLRSRLDRLQPRKAPSICDLSDAELNGRLRVICRQRLNDSDLSTEVRADLIAEVGDLVAGQTGSNPDRDARLERLHAAVIAELQADGLSPAGAAISAILR